MRANDIFDVLGGIVFVALATTIVSSRNTASIVTQSGNAFSKIISASLGK